MQGGLVVLVDGPEGREGAAKWGLRRRRMDEVEKRGQRVEAEGVESGRGNGRLVLGGPDGGMLAQDRVSGLAGNNCFVFVTTIPL